MFAYEYIMMTIVTYVILHQYVRLVIVANQKYYICFN